MKKKNFIMILLISIFIFLCIIIFKQITGLINMKNNLSIQTKKLSSSQNLDVKETSVINTSMKNNVSSAIYLENMREKDIQDRIKKYGKNEAGIPVLMYHFFYDSSSGENGKDNNFLDIAKFEQQLKYLKENDFFFPTFEELSQFINKK